MAELVLRVGYNDHVALDELLTNPAALVPRQSRYIRRVVVDATAVVDEPVFARAAGAAGAQFLVDPQTAFLTTEQDAGDNWSRLPYAESRAMDPAELRDPSARAALIEQVVEFELDHGASAIIPPYLHLSDLTHVAVKVQRLLIRDTAAHLADLGLNFSVLPVLSVDQRAVSFDPAIWPSALGYLIRGAHQQTAGPIALGLSMTSKINTTNLHAATRIWRRAAASGPFIAWHAGETGLLAVAMGAQGYETGMCTAERYNIRSQQRARSKPRAPGPRHIGAYVDLLGRSLERSAVQQLTTSRAAAGDLGCLDPACCPAGFASMLGTGRRQHAVRARIRDLEELDGIAARRWKLRHLSDRALDAAGAARRIRVAADKRGIRIGARADEFEAMYTVTQDLMATSRVAGHGGGAA